MSGSSDTLYRYGGAAAPFTEVVPVIVEHYPGLDEMFRRFASPPIRNAGTLGGNIANGSPIGDSMAALMVVGASLVLRCGDNRARNSAAGFLPRLYEERFAAGRISYPYQNTFARFRRRRQQSKMVEALRSGHFCRLYRVPPGRQ